jgi:hypothetical protein
MQIQSGRTVPLRQCKWQCSFFSKIVFLLGQERKDARLQKQADFINQFREGDIWSNVVIVVKQPGSFNVRQAGLAIKKPTQKNSPKKSTKNVFFCFFLIFIFL